MYKFRNAQDRRKSTYQNTFSCVNRHKYIVFFFSFSTDLNECSRDKYYCHQVASCTNYRGSFTCTCDQGYFGDGFECELNYASMIRYKIEALHVNDEQ